VVSGAPKIVELRVGGESMVANLFIGTRFGLVVVLVIVAVVLILRLLRRRP